MHLETEATLSFFYGKDFNMKKAAPNSKSKDGELLSRKEQRAKNQKKTHKLTKEQVQELQHILGYKLPQYLFN